MFCGFLLCYLTRTTELLLKRFTPKTLLQVDQFLNLLYPAGCILSYHYLDDKTWLVSLNIALRVYNGFLGYPRCLLLIDLTRSQFSRDFDSVNSLIQMGVYAGHGLGAAMGSGLYDTFGYDAPFYLVTVMLLLPIALTCVFVPNCPSHTVSGGDEEVLVEGSSDREHGESTAFLDNQTAAYGTCAEETGEVKSAKNTGLTPLILVPLIGTMLVNIVYGYPLPQRSFRCEHQHWGPGFIHSFSRNGSRESDLSLLDEGLQDITLRPNEHGICLRRRGDSPYVPHRIHPVPLRELSIHRLSSGISCWIWGPSDHYSDPHSDEKCTNEKDWNCHSRSRNPNRRNLADRVFGVLFCGARTGRIYH